ncbi:MAG: tape measure protein, partial [Parabacteroides gordonii]|nr:tape measure protein [Parabacteroides gordonii]
MAKLYFCVQADFDKVIKLREEIAKLKNELKNMDSTQSPVAFKTLNTQLAASTQRMDELVTNAAKAGAAIEGGFKKKIFDASQSVNVFTEKIIAQKAAVKDIEADVKRLGEAYRIALKNNPMSSSGKLSEYNSAKKALDEEKAALFGLTQEQANARLSVKKLRDEYALYQNDGKQVVETNNGIAISWKKALAVIGGTAAIKKFISDLVNVRGEFQKTQMSFETMLGSKEKADKLMAQMVETAAKTPFDLQGVANGAKQLLAYGTEAENVNDTLIRLGNIASGLSIPLGDMVYLYGTTQTQGRLFTQDVRQFMGRGIPLVKELAAMLGKTEEEINKMVTAGQIGFPQVEAVIKKMTDEGGKFYNLMQKQSETLSGQISNLGDAWDGMLNSIGEDTQGLTSKTISMATSLVENYETVGKVLAGLIVTYGTYRTAVMLVIAAESKHTLVEIGLTNARVLARKAQLALNAAMLTNPYVLLATAVVGLGAAMWAFHDSSTEAEKAQKRFNERQE